MLKTQTCLLLHMDKNFNEPLQIKLMIRRNIDVSNCFFRRLQNKYIHEIFKSLDMKAYCSVFIDYMNI